MNLKTSQKGFTIVELLIVIVVIAILAAISIVAYTGIQNRAKETSSQSLAAQIAKKADAYYTINGVYPTTLANFDATTNTETNLEGANVTFVTTSPADYAAATTAVGTGAPLTQFTSGNRVIYRGNAGTSGGSAGGYTIWYWKAGNTLGTISKGSL